MSKFHWLILLLMFQVFALLGQVNDLWLAGVLVLTQFVLAYWYMNRPGDKPYAYDIYQLGVDHGAGMERFNYRIVNEAKTFRAGENLKSGDLVYAVKPSKKKKKSTIQKSQAQFFKVKGTMNKKELKKLNAEWKNGKVFIGSASGPTKKTKKSTKKRK